MPPSATTCGGQVEVPAPPGLDTVPHVDPNMQPLSDMEFKQELVREVTEAVRQQVDRKTTAAVDLLWQRGQRAVQTLQSQQTSQTEQLRGQLAACTESYRNLERENAALRNGLEALMKHLTVVFGAPPHMQPPQLTVPVTPGGPCGLTSPAAHPLKPSPSTAASGTSLPTTPQSGFEEVPTLGADSSCDITSSKGTHSDTEDFHARSGSPERSSLQGVDEVVESGTTQSLPPSPALLRQPATTMGQSNGEAATASQQPPQPTAAVDTAIPPGLGPASPDIMETEAAPAATAAPPASGTLPVDTFNLTLRRADNVPLGLELHPGGPGDGQLVEAVHPGGAIEAWNRQCAGDTREIRVGDRIVSINGHEDPESMWEECRTKQLIRMTVLRGSPQPPQQLHVVPLPGEPPVLERTASGMRADANEFVPTQVSPWAPAAFTSAAN